MVVLTGWPDEPSWSELRMVSPDLTYGVPGSHPDLTDLKAGHGETASRCISSAGPSGVTISRTRRKPAFS